MTNVDLAKTQYRKVHAMLARKGAGEEIATALRREQRTMREVLANLSTAERRAFLNWQMREANR